MENKKEPQAIQYFFRLLDIEGHGYLTAFSLQYFFRVSEIQAHLLIIIMMADDRQYRG